MNNWKKGAASLWLICLVYIGYFAQRHEFALLFSAYSLSFLAYLFILKNATTETDFAFFVKIGWILRGVLVFSFPNLSDDIYRFIWDGRLTLLGENPFNHPPQYFIENQLFTGVLTPDLYAHLNSANYYSVYPPVCQAVFATAVFLFPKSIYGASVLIKLFLFACEAGTIWLLKNAHYQMSNPDVSQYPSEREVCPLPAISQHSPLAIDYSPFTIHYSPLIYILNPLIIIELVGNAHFEAAMIFFFLLSIYFLSHKIWQVSSAPNIRHFRSAFAWSLSVASKILPLIFLPLLLKKLAWQQSLRYWIVVGFCLLFLFAPLYNALFIENISKSLGLYFNKFEFNASLYYLARELGIWYLAWNPIRLITPIFGVILICFILFKTFGKQKLPSGSNAWQFSRDTPFDFDSCLLILSLYFAFATTVHPWYAAFPLALSVFTKWRFPLVWTFVIFLTYAGYTEGSSKHTENYGFVFLGYAAVYAYFIWEWTGRMKAF